MHRLFPPLLILFLGGWPALAQVESLPGEGVSRDAAETTFYTLDETVRVLRRSSLPAAFEWLEAQTEAVTFASPRDFWRTAALRADLLYQMGRAEEAMEGLREALSRDLHPDAAEGVWAMALRTGTRGLLALYDSRHEEARTALRSAVTAMREVGPSFDLPEMLVQLGTAAAFSDHPAEAAAAFDEAISIYAMQGRYEDGLWARIARGELITTTREEREAHLKVISEALPLAEAQSDLESMAYLHQSAAFHNESSYAAAVEAYAYSRDLAEEVGAMQMVLEITNALADLHMVHDAFAEAAHEVDKAMDLVATYGCHDTRAGTWRVLGFVWSHDPDPARRAQARDYLERAAAFFEASGDHESLAYVWLDQAVSLRLAGEIEASLGKLDQAEAWFRGRGAEDFVELSRSLRIETLKAGERWQEAALELEAILEMKSERWNAGVEERIAEVTDSQERQFREAERTSLEREKQLQELRLAEQESLIALLEARESRSVLVRNFVLTLTVLALLGTIILGRLYYLKFRAERAARELNQTLAREREEQLRQAETSAEANRELAAVNARLKEMDEQRKSLLGLAAHDMRNPIAAIQSSLELMDETLEADQVRDPRMLRELIGLCRDGADYLLNLVDRIVKARETRGLLTRFDLRWIDPKNLLLQAIQLNRPAAERKGMAFDLIEGEAVNVLVDPQGLREALDNLLSNAVKYSAPGSRIRVFLSFEEAAETVVFAIEDGGPGIAEGDFGRLFEPFAQLSARPTGGESSTGLGLHSVKQTVEAMHGTIAVSNLPETGARFVLSFPGRRIPAAAGSGSGVTSAAG